MGTKFKHFALLPVLLLILSYPATTWGFPPSAPASGFVTSRDYSYTGKFDVGGGEFQAPNGTVAQMLALTGVEDGDLFMVTDGSTASDCGTGGGSTRNLCMYDENGAAWVIAGDGTGGAGSGSVTTIEENDVQVGGADIVYLDFGTGFTITENPDTEININFDLTPSSGNATLITEEDALQVKYDTTDFGESTSGLTLGASPTIATSLAIGTDPADAGTIRLPNAGSLVWEDATEASITHVDNTGWLINSINQLLL